MLQRTVGTQLAEAGLRLYTVRPYLDQTLPVPWPPYEGLLVLGGSPGPLAGDRYPWLAATRVLLRKGVEGETLMFGICLGAD